MYWTIELAATLEDAPWPATRDELIEWAERNGCPQQVLDNLYELDEEDDTPYESIEEIWPDYIMKEDFFHNEEDEGFDYDDVWFLNFFIKKFFIKAVAWDIWATVFFDFIHREFHNPL